MKITQSHVWELVCRTHRATVWHKPKISAAKHTHTHTHAHKHKAYLILRPTNASARNGPDTRTCHGQPRMMQKVVGKTAKAKNYLPTTRTHLSVHLCAVNVFLFVVSDSNEHLTLPLAHSRLPCSGGSLKWPLK